MCIAHTGDLPPSVHITVKGGSVHPAQGRGEMFMDSLTEVSSLLCVRGINR